MNTGVQDGYNLGWKPAATLGGDVTPLDTYESERRAVAAQLLGPSSALPHKHVSSPSTPRTPERAC